MKKRKQTVSRDKPRICDPGMCNLCRYVGEGDFVCDARLEGPVVVVKDWQRTGESRNCPKRTGSPKF